MHYYLTTTNFRCCSSELCLISHVGVFQSKVKLNSQLERSKREVPTKVRRRYTIFSAQPVQKHHKLLVIIKSSMLQPLNLTTKKKLEARCKRNILKIGKRYAYFFLRCQQSSKGIHYLLLLHLMACLAHGYWRDNK